MISFVRFLLFVVKEFILFLPRLSEFSVVKRMSRPRSKKSAAPPTESSTAPVADAGAVRTAKAQPGLPPRYLEACRLAEEGRYEDARRAYAKLKKSTAKSNARLRALIRNDLAVLAAIEGEFDEACTGWRDAMEVDPDCLLARLNRDLVEAEISLATVPDDLGELKLAPAPGQPVLGAGLVPALGATVLGAGLMTSPAARPQVLPARQEPRPPDSTGGPCLHPGPTRVALLSFLFNWPSTGGGNHHTAELAKFLAHAGYEVKHYFARFTGWGIGRVTDELISPSEPIEFDESRWNVIEIQARFRRAVESFGPDYVIITDAWNMKPLLAEAVRGYPYFLLYQAQENICPLNNLRLLAIGPNQVEQCPRNQLATPEVCCRCLAERGRHSGALHQAERELAGVGTREYDQNLRASLAEAEAVLVLNPIIAAMLEPYSSRVCIVPWGMDPERFPWPAESGRPAVGAEGGVVRPAPNSRSESGTAFQAVSSHGQDARATLTTLFMAAVVGETIKGYHVAHEACRILHETRSDFELIVTLDPAGQIDEFTRSVGWCSLGELPRHYREADICLVPTIAQDSLSRTSVEAMASGIPVIASRIGGLPYTVTDDVTGLLCEPSDPVDLARQINRLLDDQPLRRRMGLAGRKRFEQDFLWETVIERHFRPLLGSPTARGKERQEMENTGI
jgi:glycosyltransferase involved in cell wall biosynthesis